MIPIHWEAVLVTAIPSFFTFLGVCALGYFQFVMHEKVKSIDHAVNGAAAGEPTIRESVAAINTAVNGAPEGKHSIKENVQTLLDESRQP
jgi:hypothetical protein